MRMKSISDLVGERGVLMGALAGIMEAQYDTLRKHGHCPSEAFNETVEELTESLIRLVAENGMDWMYSTARPPPSAARWTGNPNSKKRSCRCSRTCTRAWRPERKPAGYRALAAAPDYKEQLGKELAEIGNSEMWQAGKTTRDLRPKEPEKKGAKTAKGIGGSRGISG